MDTALHDFFMAQFYKKQDLNTNVELSTGDKVYINKFGIAKEYGSTTDYTLTAGLNSCGASIAAPMDRTWATLQHPRGTDMKPGVPCGFENSYITASFPSSVEGASSFLGINQLGKVGYVDVDNIIHPVTVNYLNTYKPSNTSNISGTNMTSCLGGNIRYGDAIYIKYNTAFLSTQSGLIKTSREKSTYYLQPISGTSTAEIKYGDLCLLTTTNVQTTSTCGLWGCEVASVSSANKLQLTSGQRGIPFRFLPRLMNNTNKSIKIGDQLCIIAGEKTNALVDGIRLTDKSAPYLTSNNGAFTLKFTNGVLAIYTSSNTIKKTIYTMISPSSTSYVVFEGGKLVFYDLPGGEPRHSIPTSIVGNVIPYKAVLCNDGELVIINGTNTVIWPTTKTDFDWPSNIYAAPGRRSEIYFANVPNFLFTIVSPLYGDGTKCSVEALKLACNNSSNCVGFIHSNTNHNWQMINDNDSSTQYQMSTTATNTYTRNISVGITGSNCPRPSTITSVPWKHMLLFPKGDVLPSTGAVCPSIPPLSVPSYDNYMTSLNDTWSNLSNSEPITSYSIANLDSNISGLSNSTASYNTAYNKVMDTYKKSSPTTDTINQRTEDSSVLDEHHKSLAILWGIISISVISIIIFRPNN